MVGSALVVAVVCTLQWLPPRWLAAPAAALASMLSGHDVTIGGLDLDLFAHVPSARVSDVRIDAGDPEASADIDIADFAVDLPALLHGALVIDRVGVHGARVRVRHESDRSAPAATPSSTARPARLPTVRLLTLDDVDLEFADEASGSRGELRVAAGGATSDDAGNWTATLDGTLDGLGIAGELTLSSLEALLDPTRHVTLSASLDLGGASARIDGSIVDMATFAGLVLDVDLSVRDPRALSALASTGAWTAPTRYLPPFAFRGHVRRDGSAWSLERVRASLGHTAIDGDVRVDPSTSPPTLYANLAALPFDLDELAVALSGSGKRGPTASPDGDTSGPSSLLPHAPLGAGALLGRARGALHLRADRIVSTSLPLESADVRVTLSDQAITLDPLALGVGTGNVSGSVRIARAGSGTPDAIDASTALKLTGLRIGPALADRGLQGEASGRLGAELKYWATGASVAELAGSLDGGGFVLLRGGTLDALLPDAAALELLGVARDVLTPWRDEIPLRCGYLDTHSTGGVTVLNRLVIDTRDAVILGRGSIDLGTEALDIVFEPHSKGSHIPGGEVSLDVGGTLAHPLVRPATAETLPAAVAAVLAEVATQVITLVPLLGGKPGPGSPWCHQLGEALDGS